MMKIIKNIDKNDYNYIERFINFIYDKYELNKIECCYLNKYDGYLFKIEKNNKFYLFIYKKDFNNFINVEKIRNVYSSNIYENFVNKLCNNINNLISKSYYFKNIFDIKNLNTINKEYYKIQSVINFNSLIV